MANERMVRIGGMSGFWGDSAEGPRQMILGGRVDYIIGDYLAEITMSLLARAREKKPDMGYAPDLLNYVIVPYARELASRKIKVVVNAGGVNPLACKDAVEAELARQGVSLKVAAVTGDDALPMTEELRAAGVKEMWTGAPLPSHLISSNAYLGAFPIAAALSAGADIVITGRCVDSALVLGPLMHEFGWAADDYDVLAGGSMAGHLIECGPQATGGVFTDWRLAADGWADIGYPIAECYPDGRFVITKPEGTGGLVSWGTVAEQCSYEIGDPGHYVLADVVCDVSKVQIRQVGPDRVEVSGIRGTAPTSTYKVSATFADGYRSIATLFVKGIDAVDKARHMGAALLERSRRLAIAAGLGDFDEESVEVLGAEDTYGPHATMGANREVILKIGAKHRERKALEIFSREIAPASTIMAQGTAGIMGGRPSVQPVVRLFSLLIEKHLLKPAYHIDGKTVPVEVRTDGQRTVGRTPDVEVEGAVPAEANVEVPLISIAYGRSGDKGDVSNIAIIGRHRAFMPIILEQVTAEAMAGYLAHVARGEVRRYPWPGLNGANFLLEEALGGGGVASLRYDPQGKAHAQMMMQFPVRVPSAWVRGGEVLAPD